MTKRTLPDVAGGTALVTGATAGIGYELARLCAHEGFELVLVARDARRLRQRANEFKSEFGATVRTIPMDLSLPGSPDRVRNILRDSGLTVDVLINNAGFGQNGPFSENDGDGERG